MEGPDILADEVMIVNFSNYEKRTLLSCVEYDCFVNNNAENLVIVKSRVARDRKIPMKKMSESATEHKLTLRLGKICSESQVFFSTLLIVLFS